MTFLLPAGTNVFYVSRGTKAIARLLPRLSDWHLSCLLLRRLAVANLLTRNQAMIPSTVERVPRNTDQRYNEEIRRQTEADIAAAAAGGPRAIAQRLDELDHEWDIERTLEANAATVSLIGVILGATVDRRFFYLPGLVGGFL